MKTNKEDFEEIIGKCFGELSVAAREKYDSDRAEKTAAVFLAAQMQLAYFISDIELRARHSKNEIARIEAVKYYEIKENAAGKKTEEALKQALAKDSEVIEAKRVNTEAEADMKKYNYIMATLRDGHIYFRSLSKKSWNE